MVSHTYLHVQQLVTQLSPHDQARLLEYLSSRMAYMVSLLSSESSPTPPPQATTWDEFFRVGNGVMNSDTSDSQTLTNTVVMMRR